MASARVFARRASLGAGLAALLAAGPAAAGPPFFVDDPGTMEHGHLFLYLIESGTWNHRSQVFPNLSLAYGVTPRLEVSAGAATSPGTAVTSHPRRFGDPFAAAKWRFQDEKGLRPALGVSYQATHITVDNGFDQDYLTHSGWVTAAHALGSGQIFAHLGGSGSPRDGAPSVFWGAAADWPLGKRLRAGVEIYGQSGAPGAGLPRELGQGIGLTYTANRRTTLLLQVGHTHRADHEATLYFGVLLDLAH